MITDIAMPKVEKGNHMWVWKVGYFLLTSKIMHHNILQDMTKATVKVLKIIDLNNY